MKTDTSHVTLADLHARLHDYEERFGVPSERLTDAFRCADGQVRETPEMRSWSMLYRSVQELTRRATAPA